MTWHLVSEQYGSKLYVSSCWKYAKKDCYVFGKLRSVTYKLGKCGK